MAGKGGSGAPELGEKRLLRDKSQLGEDAVNKGRDMADAHDHPVPFRIQGIGWVVADDSKEEEKCMKG